MKRVISVLTVVLIFVIGCTNQKLPSKVSDSTQAPSTMSDKDSPANKDNSIDERGLSYKENTSDNTGNKDREDHISAPKENSPNNSGEIIEIGEKMFIAQCNDIYLNPNDYLDKTVTLEGIYDEYADPDAGETYYFVIRYGPGCCGFDDVAGFQILYDGELPALNDWIEVVGTVEIYEEDGLEYIAIRASEVNVLDVRGAEFVTH